MAAHLMELPRKVAVGIDIVDEIPQILQNLELGSRCLAVAGPHVRKIAGGDLDRVLRESRYEVSWETVRDSTFEVAEIISRKAREMRASFLIGVGGGKSIDLAKLASFQSKLPFVSIPTSASHDGISSPFASVKGLSKPYSIVARPPIAIVADVGIISKSSARLLLSGCGDLVSKKTAVKDWELARDRKKEYYGLYSANLALLSANLILDNSERISAIDLESVRIVVEALISAGVAAGIAGSSRPCSGSEHLFSHAMDIVAPGKGLHGEKCGIGTIMMAHLYSMDFDRIRTGLEIMGAPTSAKEIGASSEEIVKSLVISGSLRKERYTILDERKLDENSARDLALETKVI